MAASISRYVYKMYMCVHDIHVLQHVLQHTHQYTMHMYICVCKKNMHVYVSVCSWLRQFRDLRATCIRAYMINASDNIRTCKQKKIQKIDQKMKIRTQVHTSVSKSVYTTQEYTSIHICVWHSYMYI